MTWRLASLAVVAALLFAANNSCSSGPESRRGVGPGSRTGQRRVVQRGRFADAVQVGKNRWMLLNDAPPPLDRDEFSLDGDGGGGTGDGGGQRRPGGQKKKRFGQSPVYVDGVPTAVVAYGELPPWLRTRWVRLNDGRKVIRFVFADYLRALGVPLRRVQAVHLYGGRGRVGTISGAELRRVRDRLLFSFTRGDAGKMRMHWDGDVQVSDSIDKVQAVAVYVDRVPPRWDRGKWGLVNARGIELEGIPYAKAPLKGGVRIYLDGRIAHVLKRNRTFERKIEPARIVGGVPTFGMFDYLDQVGVDARRVAAVELLDENQVALRLDGRRLKAERATAELSAPPRSSGRVVVHLGGAAARRDVEVTAINLYTRKRAGAHARR